MTNRSYKVVNIWRSLRADRLPAQCGPSARRLLLHLPAPAPRSRAATSAPPSGHAHRAGEPGPPHRPAPPLPLSRPRSPPSYPLPHRSLPHPPLRLKVKPRRPEPRENAPVIDISGFYPGRRRGRLGRGGGGRGWSVVWRKRRRGCGRGMGLLPRMRRVHPWVGLLRQHPPRYVHEHNACPEYLQC